MSKYDPIVDGAWWDVGRTWDHQCCDCGLVHRVTFRIKDGILQVQWIRNNRKTAAVRRERHKHGRRV